MAANLSDSSNSQGEENDSKKPTGSFGSSSKVGNLLPDFPVARDFVLPESIPLVLVETFIIMYRAHCQRILDTVVRANFEDVRFILTCPEVRCSFWFKVS
eukprot:m.153984 g.153984  ORF g.153984 m.153984 type:complete len:100 (+) comp38630_c0_seq35:115-414(+)